MLRLIRSSTDSASSPSPTSDSAVLNGQGCVTAVTGPKCR